MKGAKNEDAAKAFVDGLLDGAGKDALRRGRLRAAAGPVRPFGPAPRSRSLVARAGVPDAADRRRSSSTPRRPSCASSLGEEGALDALRLSLRARPRRWSLIVAGRHAGRLPAGDARASAAARVVITLVELPLVLPPAVAGIGLLAALGPQGIFGGAIGDRLAC